MRILIYFSCFVTLNLSCKAQLHPDSDSVISMLNEYYKEHAAIWLFAKEIPPQEFNKKLDSLQLKYCTQKLRSDSKKYLVDGHDLLTNDFGIDNLATDSAISINPTNIQNEYLVSYYVRTYPVSPTAPVVQRISFTVVVLKEKNIYKIDNVK